MVPRRGSGVNPRGLRGGRRSSGGYYAEGAPQRPFDIAFFSCGQADSCDSAALSVVLGRIAWVTLSKSGR
jgi:hypothetical protein